MKKDKKERKGNYLAKSFRTRSWGSGNHGDKRKERSRKACRGKVRHNG